MKTKDDMPSDVPEIEKLYDRFSRKLYYTSLRITNNSFDAEEIMQDAFIKYYRSPEKREIRNPESWLTRVCIRQSIDRLRTRTRESDFLTEWQEERTACEEAAEPETNAPAREGKIRYEVEQIRYALRHLPDGYRIILTLSLFEGYDNREIAQIMQISENTVRTQYMRGRQKLIKQLQTEGKTGPVRNTAGTHRLQ